LLSYICFVKDDASVTVSVTLDDESESALLVLESSGLTRSEAIRHGLRVAVRQLQRDELVRRQAEIVAADEHDRERIWRVVAFMKNLRGVD
jgi:hypothetical protein